MEYDRLKAELNSLEDERSNSAKEQQRLCNKISEMKTIVDQLQLNIRESKEEKAKLELHKIRRQNFVNFHDNNHIDWTPIIGNDQFNYPEISFSTNSQDSKSNFSGIMCPEFVYVVLPPDSFTRLWKFNYNVIMIKFLRSLNHEPLRLPNNDPRWHVFPGYSIFTLIYQ